MFQAEAKHKSSTSKVTPALALSESVQMSSRRSASSLEIVSSPQAVDDDDYADDRVVAVGNLDTDYTSTADLANGNNSQNDALTVVQAAEELKQLLTDIGLPFHRHFPTVAEG